MDMRNDMVSRSFGMKQIYYPKIVSSYNIPEKAGCYTDTCRLSYVQDVWP